MSRFIRLLVAAGFAATLGACAPEPVPYAVAEAPPPPRMKSRHDAKYDLESGAPRPGYGRPLPPPHASYPPVASYPPQAGYPPVGGQPMPPEEVTE